MKRALLLLPLALGAVLWGVNWKLDHPPQTKADAVFARSIQGADEVEVSSCLGHRQVVLRGREISNLIGSVHLKNDSAPSYSSCDSRYTLKFHKQQRELATFDVDFDAKGLERTSGGKVPFNARLEPRTGAKLERTLFDLMTRAPSP